MIMDVKLIYMLIFGISGVRYRIPPTFQLRKSVQGKQAVLYDFKTRSMIFLKSNICFSLSFIHSRSTLRNISLQIAELFKQEKVTLEKEIITLQYDISES